MIANHLPVQKLVVVVVIHVIQMKQIKVVWIVQVIKDAVQNGD